MLVDGDDLVFGSLVLLAIVVCVFGAATLFAAPGYVVLLIAGHESIGFWNSAAAGLGSIILGGLIGFIIRAFRS